MERLSRMLLLLSCLVLLGISIDGHAPAGLRTSLEFMAPGAPTLVGLGSSAGFLQPPGLAPNRPLGTPGTSVIPPGPPTNETCSTDNLGPVTCSATAANDRCSALHENANFCTASNTFSGDRTCSAFGADSVCSVLPPSQGHTLSTCSNFSHFVGFLMRCSAVGQGDRLLCSTKGLGGTAASSQCSAFRATGDSECSVLNFGATTRSYCSTKANQPLAKACSAFSTGTNCSVAAGGAKGVCTTFGQALAGSCSSFVQPSHCSVIGGSVGDPCLQ